MKQSTVRPPFTKYFRGERSWTVPVAVGAGVGLLYDSSSNYREYKIDIL